MIIGFDISADYGHFSHPATVYSSLSYPVPPKTTVMGMLGAIMGLENYLAFNAIRYSVVIKTLAGKRTFCFNGVKDALSQLNLEKAGAGFSKGRKQFYRELLVAPSYTIYCDLSGIDADTRNALIATLEAGKSMYPLYMGINMCLAELKYRGAYELRSQEAERVAIHSMVPLSSTFELEAGKQYSDIRMATSVDAARNFGGFSDYLVETTGESITCKACAFHVVGEHNIILS